MRQTIEIFDRSGNQLASTAGLPSRIRNLSWRTGLPGGFLDCSFDVQPFGFTRGWDVSLGYSAYVSQGLLTLFAGRLEDLAQILQLPGSLANGYRRVRVYGWWQNLLQRLQTATYAAGAIYSSDILNEALKAVCPLVSLVQDGIAPTGANIQPVAWDHVYVNELLDSLLQYGNSANKELLFAIWEDKPAHGKIAYSDWHQGCASNATLDWQWSSTVVNNAQILMSGANLRLYSPASSDKATIVLSSALPIGHQWWVLHAATVSPTGGHFYPIAIFNLASKPTVTDTTPDIFIRQHSGGAVKMGYRDAAGAYHWWDGAAWQGVESTAYAGVAGTAYNWVLSSNATSWKLSLETTAGAVLMATPAIAWANTYNNLLSPWLLAGDPSGAAGSGNLYSTTIEVHAPTALPMAYLWPRNLNDFDLQIPLASIGGEVQINNSLGKVATAVLASYGSPVAYTANAFTPAAAALYDRRDYKVDAGSVPATVATAARDMYAKRHSEPSHELSPISAQGRIRDKAGANFPLPLVRAGMRFRIPEFGDTNYLISATDYNADTGVMQISIDDTPDTVAMMLARAALGKR